VIGWYVHGHGQGHLQRLQCIAPHLRTPVTALSSLPQPDGWEHGWLPLDDDLPRGDDADPTAGGTLHWAPRQHPGLRSRMADLAAWVAREQPSLVVVDVSVEVAVLVRALGVPVVVTAMRGDRTDRAHRTAYDLAEALLAPWPEAFPEPWPQEWLDKAWHVGALSRLDDRPAQPPPGERRVAVLWGRGGAQVTAGEVAAAAAATPGWTWTAAGLPGAPWVDDVPALLGGADVVVTHAGQNALAEVAACRRAAVVVPQARPHDEQVANARALAQAGLAVVAPSWPEPQEWPALLGKALANDPQAWRTWNDGLGARRAAARLDEAAGR
jgi:hypothetical protein